MTLVEIHVKSSGQIIAISREFFTPEGSQGREMGPLISGKSRLAK